MTFCLQLEIHTKQVEHQSDNNPVNVQTLTQNAQNLHGISNMSETSQIEILLFLRTSLFIQSTCIHCACWWAFQDFRQLPHRLHHYELGKPLKKLCSAHYLLSKSCCHVMCLFFPSLNQNLQEQVILSSLPFYR